MDIAFYHLTTSSLEKALPKLLEKIHDKGYRTVVWVDTIERARHLNTMLWTYSPGSFLPHDCEGDPAMHPIWLTTQLSNPNQADVVVLTCAHTMTPQELPPAQRYLDIFEGSDAEMLRTAHQRHQQYSQQGYAIKYWRQSSSGGWEQCTDGVSMLPR